MTAIDLGLARFLSFAGRVLPWLAAATLLAFGLGLALSLAAPDNYWQGATVKIMFLHVPSAWLITLIWVVMSIAAVATLVCGDREADDGQAPDVSRPDRAVLDRGASRARRASRRGLDPCRGRDRDAARGGDAQ
jgi:hypothetical protein